jgi:hypothetical protein
MYLMCRLIAFQEEKVDLQPLFQQFLAMQEYFLRPLIIISPRQLI